MAGRLGVLGSLPTQSYSGGRVGALAIDPNVTRQRNEQANDAKADAQLKQEQQTNNNPFNIIKTGLEKTVGQVSKVAAPVLNEANNVLGAKSTRGGKTVKATTLAKSAVDSTGIPDATQQIRTAVKGGVTAPQGGAGLNDQSLVNNQVNYIKSQIGKSISQEDANKQIANLQSKASAKQSKLQTAEKATGTTLNESQGAGDVLNAAATATGLVGSVKGLIEKGIGKYVSKQALKDADEQGVKTASEPIPEPIVTQKPTTPVKGRITEPEQLLDLRKNTAAPVETPEPTKPFAPLDESTRTKIDTLAQESGKKPVEPGTTRLYQMNDKGAEGVKSDQFFKDPSKLANFANGRSENADLTFKDVPNDQVKEVAGKPDVFKVSDEPTPAVATPDRVVYETDPKTGVQTPKTQEDLLDDISQLRSIPQSDRTVTQVTQLSDKIDALKNFDEKSVVPKAVEETAEKPQGDTVSGNANRIQETAVASKLIERTEDLPEYASINMKDQAEKAVNLVNNDRQKAIDIVEGKENPPGNLKTLSIHQALEEVATREGDGELLNKLAHSHINTELSESAQNLRIAAERDPNSPVEQIRKVNDALKKSAERRTKTTVSKELKNARSIVKKSTRINNKADLNSFIKGLTC